MKKIVIIISILVTSLIISACEDSETTIHVIATAVPHAEILYEAESIINQSGYNLKVTVVDDYSIMNRAVATNSADANFFQHIPYLDEYNSSVGESERLVNVAGIHIEPLAGYSKTINNLSELSSNARILISTSTPDHGRILFILKEHGVIELKEGATRLTATLDDVVNSSFQFIQVDPSLLSVTYVNSSDIDLAFINGNYALSANLNQSEQVVVESGVDNPYVNVVAVLNGNENSDKTRVLVEALKSDYIKDFINQKYGGSVIAV